MPPLFAFGEHPLTDPSTPRGSFRKINVNSALPADTRGGALRGIYAPAGLVQKLSRPGRSATGCTRETIPSSILIFGAQSRPT